MIIKKNKFKKIRDLYRDGKVLVIPADTVFGLTCLINNVKATKSIFRIKRRSHLKPLPILFANWDQAKLYLSLTESEINTLKQIKFDWPVTLIIENKHHHDVTPWNYLLNYKSIAFRVVKQTWLSKLIKITGPIFATSCNFTGEFPIKKWKTITKHLKINYVVKGVIDYYRTSILYDVINKKIIRG